MIKKYTLKNGETRYQFQVYVGTDELTGKQQRTTRRGFKSKKEAELEQARIKLQIANGDFRKEHAETFQEIYEMWLLQYENTVEESTFIKTETIFQKHILPAIGSYKLDKMNVDICQAHVNEWATYYKKFRVVKSYAARVMNFAIKRGYIKTNPFDLVEMPRKPKQNQIKEEIENFYTREELLKFLSCLKKENNFMRFVFFRLLAYSGMRKGEAFALNWSDIDLETNKVRINKALSLGKDNVLYVKSTKTGTARTIIIDKDTTKILKEWKTKQKEKYLILGYDTTKAKQLVFSNTKNEFIHPSRTYPWITQIQKKYNLPKITTHGLRHTHISLLFEAGASIKEVQDRVGHTDIKTTMDIYTHLTEQAKEEAVLKFESYLNPEDDS